MTSNPSAHTYDRVTFSADDPSSVRAGIFLAWVVNHQLASERLLKEGGANVTKVRLRAIRGSELLTTVCHGELNGTHLSETGNQFAALYYEQAYRAAFAEALRQQDERVRAVHDESLSEWSLYDHLAPIITRAYRQAFAPSVASGAETKEQAKKPRPSWLRIVK